MNKLVPLVLIFLFSWVGISAQRSLWQFGVSAFPNYSNCLDRFGYPGLDPKFGTFSVSGGLFSELLLSQKFSLQFGLGFSAPSYRRSTFDVIAEDPNDPALPSKIKVRFNTQSVEIPYNLIWRPVAKKPFFISAGLASYLSFAKKSTLIFVYKGNPDKRERNTIYDLKYGSGVQLGTGTSVKLSKSLTLDIGVEFKLMRLQFDNSFESKYFQAGLKTAVKI